MMEFLQSQPLIMQSFPVVLVVVIILIYLFTRRQVLVVRNESLEFKYKIIQLTEEANVREQQLDLLINEKASISWAEREATISVEKLTVELANLRVRGQEQKSEISASFLQNERSYEKQLDLKNEQIADYKDRLAVLVAELKSLQGNYAEQGEQYASLRSALTEKQKGFEDQEKRLSEQENRIRQEFENLANRIFESKGKTFNEQSRQSINDLLNPFRQQISEFKQKVEDIHVKEIQQQASLSKELTDLKELNRSMTEQAHGLAIALQGQKKTQGNWGELILENVLDRAGLILGRDYDREASFNTDEGRSRPDAIIYLPQNKHLIIDAKVSLNAYTRYMNSEGEQERTLALKEHVSAFSARIKELSDRNYYQIQELNSPEMVFMFVPIESAFIEAVKADESLFQHALELNVLVATPTTLLTSLNIVKQLWRFEDQNKHTAEIAEKAGKIYDKVNTFLGSMQGIGKQLDKAKEHYDRAFSQLYAGRGNLVKQVSDFKKLGVSVKTEIGKDIIEKAEMELDLLTPDEIAGDWSTHEGDHNEDMDNGESIAGHQAQPAEQKEVEIDSD